MHAAHWRLERSRLERERAQLRGGWRDISSALHTCMTHYGPSTRIRQLP